MKKFCPYCKDETDVEYLRKKTFMDGVYEFYECLMCHNEVVVNLGEESLRPLD